MGIPTRKQNRTDTWLTNSSNNKNQTKLHTGELNFPQVDNRWRRIEPTNHSNQTLNNTLCCPLLSGKAGGAEPYQPTATAATVVTRASWAGNLKQNFSSNPGWFLQIFSVYQFLWGHSQGFVGINLLIFRNFSSEVFALGFYLWFWWALNWHQIICALSNVNGLRSVENASKGY